MRNPATPLARVLALLATTLIAVGCSRSLLTAPEKFSPSTVAFPMEPVGTSDATSIAPPPPSQLTLLGSALPVLSGAKSLLSWVHICDALVRKDEDKVVSASHYELHFHDGSLASDTTVTIEEHDPGVLDVQLGPHGVQFGTSVELSVDFAGTSADPGAVAYDHSDPVLYWLNERTNQWEEVPGRTDWANKRHIVELRHFSRYVLGGKAGWHQVPGRAEN